MEGDHFPIRSSGWSYGLVIGVVLGMLVAGLAVPLMFGDRVAQAPSRPVVGLQDGTVQSTSVPTSKAAAAPRASRASPRGITPAGEPGPTSKTPRRPIAGAASGSRAPISVGIPIFDLGFRVPGVDPEEQKAQWNSYIDDVNARGGVRGRKIRPTYAGYDPLNADSIRGACLELTEDAKVFAVFAYGLFDNQILCFTDEHRTPLVNGIGLSDEIYRKSQGRAVTAIVGKTRALRNQVAELHRLGVLKGKTIGVLTSTDRRDNVAVNEGLVPALRARGYKVAHYANLSSDLATGQAQIPVAVRDMRAKNVDLVFLAANLLYSGTFVNNADGQLYRPLYTTSDLDQMAEDAQTARMPSSFEGSIGITTLRTGEEKVGRAEPAFDKRCRTIYEKASGTKYGRGALVYNTTMAMCSVVDIFRRGATAAGPVLSKSSLRTGFDTLTGFPLAYSDGGSLGPQKDDAPRSVRVVKWKANCTCWLPAGDFHRMSS